MYCWKGHGFIYFCLYFSMTFNIRRMDFLPRPRTTFRPRRAARRWPPLEPPRPSEEFLQGADPLQTSSASPSSDKRYADARCRRRSLLPSPCRLTVFWDRHWVLLVDFLPRGTTISVAIYCETVEKKSRAIKKECPRMLTNGVNFNHDIAHYPIPLI